MSLQALSDYTIASRYSRHNKHKKRRETWSEMVDRVFDMHEIRYAEALKSEEFRAEFEFAKEMVKKKRVLGAQRILQFGGEPIFKHNSKVFNCSYGYIDRPAAFNEAMYLLLCGCGVGFSVQKKHVAKLPDIQARTKGKKVFVAEDSIEGWADAIAAIMSSYFVGGSVMPEYEGYEVEFDLTQIRPEGSLIAGQFKAPGPDGLAASLQKIKILIDARLEAGETRLRSIDVYDCIMHFSDAVLSGGVRRSATICLFSKDDAEMMGAKTGDWYIKNPQRGRSNNSVLLVKDSVSHEEFSKIMDSTRAFGEPGFVFSDSEDIGYNPCFSIDTKILTVDGWRNFGELLGKQPKIIQDSRVLGKIENGKELWDIDMSAENSGIVNQAESVFKTAEDQEIFEITLSCGRKVKATANHHFATTNGMVMLKDLKEKDQILIGLPELAEVNKNSYDFKLGYLAGHIAGDGCFLTPKSNSVRFNVWGDENKEETTLLENLIKEVIEINKDFLYNYNNTSSFDPKFCRNESEKIGNKARYGLHSSPIFQIFSKFGFVNKNDFSWLFYQSKDFKAGFVSGLGYTDGHTEWNDKSRSLSFRIASSNKELVFSTQLILQELGIFSRVNLSRKEGYSMLPDNNRIYKPFKTQDQLRLIVGGQKNCFNLQSITNLHKKDNERINQVKVLSSRPQKQSHYSSIKSIKYFGIEDVYCLKEDNRRTLIAEGMTARRCVEIGLYPQTKDGRSGWQFCNLTEANGKYCDTKEKFLSVCRASAIIGTMQAGYTQFKYLSKETQEITEQEALLGCSITGVMDNPDILLDPEVQKEGAEMVKATNKKIASLIGVNQAARTTCIKPAGSTSCVLSSSSGIHPHHARRYIRRVQANRNEFPVQHFKKVNPLAVEKSVWSTNGTDEVISFLCEVPKGAITKNNLRAVDLLEKVKLTQQNWVEYGTNQELCLVPYVRHNVSNTITVKDDEWDEVRDYIYENRQWFAGISLLSASGDLDYPQAPFTSVLDEKELVVEYGPGAILASGLIVDGLSSFNNNLWAACDTLNGIGEKLSDLDEPSEPQKPSRKNFKNEKDYSNALANYAIELNLFFQAKGDYRLWELKKDWVRRANQFAARYFNGDQRKMAHCLKHCYTLKQWLDLKREYKEVDWAEAVEENETYVSADTLAGQACAGGACELK